MTISRYGRPEGALTPDEAAGGTLPAAPAEERVERDIERLAEALGDPTRRAAFFCVVRAGAALSKAEVAEALRIDRRLAGFHLDKLVAQGFLDAEFRRPEGRSGPGAGRPTKRYRAADTELSVEFPERHYELLASLLVRALGEEEGSLEAIGYDFGFRAGLSEVAAGADAPDGAAPRESLARLLSRFGYAARAEGDGRLHACNCPFEEVAAQDPERICALDGAIWRGMLAAFSPEARLEKVTTRARGDDACTATVAERASLEPGDPR